MSGERPKGWKLLKAALATRKAATMLAIASPVAVEVSTWQREASAGLRFSR